MSTPEHGDLTSRLRASRRAPEMPASFFDTLAFSAAHSSPSPPVSALSRIGRAKLVAVAAGTAVLVSGAAYAGGFMGGGDDSNGIAPTQHTSDKSHQDRADRGQQPADKQPKPDKAEQVQPADQPSSRHQADPGSTAVRPETPASDDGDRSNKQGWPGCWPKHRDGDGDWGFGAGHEWKQHGKYDADEWKRWWKQHGWGCDGEGPWGDGDWGDWSDQDGWGDGDWGDWGDQDGWGDGDHDWNGWGDGDQDWGNGDKSWGDGDQDWGNGDQDWGDDDNRDGGGEHDSR